jgi:hypothetical protein
MNIGLFNNYFQLHSSHTVERSESILNYNTGIYLSRGGGGGKENNADITSG